jgi:uncharacterized integral membrane protein
MLQNTRSVEDSFVGLHGTLPLAMSMLIAAIGGILLTLGSCQEFCVRELCLVG